MVSRGVNGEETGNNDRVAATPAVKFCWVNCTAWKSVPLGVLEKAMVKTCSTSEEWSIPSDGMLSTRLTGRRRQVCGGTRTLFFDVTELE